MSSWQCPECRTVYPVGIPACPNHEEASVAKVSAAGATQYVPEGAPVPGDVPASVRLVGPGAPKAEVPEPALAAGPRVKAPRARVKAGG